MQPLVRGTQRRNLPGKRATGDDKHAGAVLIPSSARSDHLGDHLSYHLGCQHQAATRAARLAAISAFAVSTAIAASRQ
jgi:hypothetical protein